MYKELIKGLRGRLYVCGHKYHKYVTANLVVQSIKSGSQYKENSNSIFMWNQLASLDQSPKSDR